MILMFCVLKSYFVKVNAIRKADMDDEEHLNLHKYSSPWKACVWSSSVFTINFIHSGKYLGKYILCFLEVTVTQTHLLQNVDFPGE